MEKEDQLMATDIIKRNNVRVLGSGEQTLLFAHGFGFDQRTWERITPAFEEHFTIVLFDYTGFGGSDKSAYSPERYQSLDGYAEDIIDICDSLQLQRVTFIGHSVSSMIGALASIKEPDLIDRLIMIGPSPRYLNDDGYNGGFERQDVEALLDMMEKNFKEWARYLAPLSMKNEDRPQLTAAFEETLTANDPEIARQFAEVTFFSDMRKELANIVVPTLILQTRSDTIAPVQVGSFVHESIPNSQFILMEATGHNPQISHPEELIDRIQTYLAN